MEENEPSGKTPGTPGKGARTSRSPSFSQMEEDEPSGKTPGTPGKGA